ncbi:methyltransferase domain-containing protein [Hyphomonas sp.]|uniref:methyltransferase domain-containing protein n=1 Tax=Hyphomonas sp. TaxID=87 RepID=UPI003918AD4D
MVSPPPPPQIFDRARIARRRERMAPRFADYAFLRARVSSDLESRLSDTPRLFEHGLELGAAGGALSAGLIAVGKVAAMTAADTASAFTERAASKGLIAIIADEEALPFAPESFDLVLSPLTLHWVNDLPGALIQVRRVLKPDGLFLAALFGAGTLAELREVLAEAETELTGGLSPRLSPLPGLRDMAGLLQRAGFALPVADRDPVTVRYARPEDLLADLKGMGERAAFANGAGRPLPRRVLSRAMELYRERFSDPDGRVRASFEIVHLSGWAPAPGQPQPLKPGSATASLAGAVRSVSRKPGS